MQAKICGDLPICEGGSWGKSDVVIGPSPDSRNKCVDNPHAKSEHPVVCGDTAEQQAEGHTDKFRIYYDGPSICATRTDYPDPWGANLILSCKVPYEDGIVEKSDEWTTIHIGDNLEENDNSKCIKAPKDVHCDDSAEAQGTGEFPDEFRIMHNGGKICAYRTDSNHAWGMDLVVKCKTEKGFHENAESEHGYTEIAIGDTLEDKKKIKCVHDPGNVVCDDHAEQVGRTGKWPDKFAIYHEDGKICAKRTDSDSPWGLNLVVKCKNK